MFRWVIQLRIYNPFKKQIPFSHKMLIELTCSYKEKQTVCVQVQTINVYHHFSSIFVEVVSLNLVLLS